MHLFVVLFFYIQSLIPIQGSTGVFKATKGTITFKSVAPLETITATSENLKGVIDTISGSFAFSVSIRTFVGFNSKLQQEHFNENYLETAKFPNATFTGKIIEEINFSQPGTYSVRAKGAFTIHGVKQERLIKGQVEITGKSIIVTSTFNVALIDHDISVPRVVHQKIAPEIEVSVKSELFPFRQE